MTKEFFNIQVRKRNFVLACLIVIMVSIITAGTWDSKRQTLQYPLSPLGEEVGFLPPLLISCCDPLEDAVTLEFHQLPELLSFIFPILFFPLGVPWWSYVISVSCSFTSYPLRSEPGLTLSQKPDRKVLRVPRSAFGLLPGCTL